jgi:hypothetical protein
VVLKERLKAYARSLGFDLIGVAAAGPTPSADRYEEWVRAGRAATMAYLTRPDAIEKRRDIRNLWPEARSVIVVAMNYYAGDPPPPREDVPQGRVARYAWGEDYHEVLRERLEALLAFLNREAGRPVRGRIYVDTGPVLERAWAVQAGLGWIGKNSMLIHPRLGSYLFLGSCCWIWSWSPTRLPNGPLRHLHPLHRGVPDALHPPRSHTGGGALPLLPDHRAAGGDPDGAAGSHRGLDLRVRHLPGSLPLEPAVRPADR